jgi:hypothetical protein
MTATPEELAQITFEASGIEHENNLQVWLDRARKEFFMSQVAADVINKDDLELEKFIQGLGETLEERATTLVEMVEWFEGWSEYYKAARDVTGTAHARLMIMAGRIAEGRLS